MKRKVSFLLAGIMVVSLFSGCSNIGSSGSSAENTVVDNTYQSKLFDTSYVHKINVDISDDDWSDLLENPLEKTKYKVNVTVDGDQVDSVSIATKGNTSLSSVASDEDSDRYSFKINFGKYVDGQTYYGLNKLNLSNIYADATYMKDYLSYEIFRKIGVQSALSSYVWLTINGEDYGLYLAVEDISDGYLDRTENGEGELYKPETEQLANVGQMGNGQDKQTEGANGTDIPADNANTIGGQMPAGDVNANGQGMPANGGGPTADGQIPDGQTPDGQMPAEQTTGEQTTGGAPTDMQQGGNKMQGFGMSQSDSGASLSYTDDELDSYSDIFDNAETKVTDEDKQRVIEALKKLSEGTDLESCLDTDSVIRYFVAHNFVMNYDSYTGNMLHNYYLYEKDGKLSVLPWDYNLAYGTFMNGEDATSIINYGIDTPLSGASEEDRPLWNWIVENEEYLNLYHQYYQELLSDYFESGTFATEIDRVYNMILPYVEKDPTQFYTSTEFTQGYNTLKSFCLLRAESIRKQLNGTLSTKTTEQNSSDYVDASSINIQDMGSQNGAGDKNGKPDMQNGGNNTNGAPAIPNGGDNTNGVPAMPNGGDNTNVVPAMPGQQNSQN